MSKSIRRFLSFFLVLQLIIPYSIFAAATGKFTSVIGGVKQTRGKEVIKPVVKSPIQVKDIILTDKESSAMMVFPDKSIIKLEQNSKLEINEFLFKEKSRTAIFSLAVGKMSATVNKFIGDDNVFEVHSPTAIVGVRGTGFEFVEALNAENKNMATVSCTKGSLNLSALSPAGTVVSTGVLEAGQVAVIVGGIITISAITAAATTVGTGLSTGAKVGIAAAAIAAVGGGLAVAAGAGSDDDDDDDEGDSGGGTTPCNQQQVAGGDTADSRNVELGKTSGTFNFSYDTYSIKDRIVLKCQSNGSTLYDTGCVGTSNTVSVNYSCPTSRITVSVTPNCQYGVGTAWEYIVYCP